MNDEIVSYLEESGGAALRDKFVNGADSGCSTPRSFRPTARPEKVAPLVELDAVLVGQPRVGQSRPGHRASAEADVRAARRVRHRLHAGVPVVVARACWTPATTSCALRCCAPSIATSARLFTPYADRLTSAALIPMATPEEAVAELRYAVQELGFKSVVIAGHAIRKLTDDPTDQAYRLDTFGIDSAYDYDPFWAACVELGVNPVTHSSLQAHRSTRSVVQLRLQPHRRPGREPLRAGQVARDGRRFPALPRAADRFPRGRRRVGGQPAGRPDRSLGQAPRRRDRRRSIPAMLDVDALMGTLDGVRRAAGARSASTTSGPTFTRTPGRPAELDEFAAAGFTSVDEIIDVFSDRMYFGCEADDPLVGWATGTTIKHRTVSASADPRHRHLALGRSGHERGHRRGVRVARRQGASTRPTSAPSRSRTRCRCTRSANKDFFVGTVCEQEAATVKQDSALAGGRVPHRCQSHAPASPAS